MPLAFFISKSWEGQSLALTPAVQIATFDDSADLLETLLWHSLQKLLRFMVLLSTAPKLMTSLGKHGWRALQQKAQNSLAKRALPSVPHSVTLISADIRGPWKGFPLLSSSSSCFEQLWNKRPISKVNISKSSQSRKTSHVKGTSLGIGNEDLKTPEGAHKPHHSSLNLKQLRLKLMIPLPLLPKCQDHRHVQPHLS